MGLPYAESGMGTIVMSFWKIVGCATVAALFGMHSAFAATTSEPRVVVSLPPLHSLVAKLLRGVATPELLMPRQVADHLVDLSGAQVEALRKADLVVWDGPGLEQGIAEAGLVMPDLSRRTLTISDHIPILTLGSKDNPDLSSGQRDLRFWLDPRLAHEAIHIIAPALVRLYPAAANTILDNEIAVMHELHHIEHSIRAELGTSEGVPLHMGTGDLRYLEWRFNLAQEHCERGGFDPIGFGLAPGADLYNHLMDGARDALLACQKGKVAVLLPQDVGK